MSRAAVRTSEVIWPGRAPFRRVPVLVAALLVALGILAVAVRLDAPADGTRVTDWQPGGVVVAVDTAASGSRGLVTGDVVLAIAGHRLTEPPGALAVPSPGTTLAYQVQRADHTVAVVVERPAVWPMLRYGWGNLVFVIALALLAGALYARRPDEPATAPLLVAAAGLLGSTLAVVAGVPALAMVTGGPLLRLYNVNVIGSYAIAWGALLPFSLLLPGDAPVARRWLISSALAPPVVMLAVLVLAGWRAADWMDWFAQVYAGTTVVVILSLLATGAIGVLAYLRSDRADARARLRWVAGGSAATAVLGLVGWHLPAVAVGHSLLPAGALGLSGLPFIIGVGVALRRHRLFDIERLANRSLTYLAVTAVLVGGYAVLVALLGGVLGLSGGVAAALSAAVAAVVLAPLLRVAQRAVNRLMYGDRDDPAGVLARLGHRMQGVMLPDDVLPAVVETVAQSLRLPYVAVDLVEPPDGEDETPSFRCAAEHGVAVTGLHIETLTHHGVTVGRLRVSDRGPDDPLDAADLTLLGSLAGEIGPAVQAVRLHQDLLRSRAEVVALREDERRRLRRDLHDGLGPALAAIGLKAGLARREVPAASPAHELLGAIDTEVKASLGGIRRLVEGLRPPALDELGLLGALRSRASTLAGELTPEVTGELPPGGLPAAVEAAAYWIGVEALTNAARHSGARRCAVDLRAYSDALVLIVADDGHGLDPSLPSGVGLRSMRERAAEVGGSVLIRSTDEGAEVVARLPLVLGGLDGHADPR
jgi:two-component system NarL family sensor kinase